MSPDGQSIAAIVPGGENAGAAPLCAGCRCISAALAEVGLDPDRVMCSEHVDGDGVIPSQKICSVGLGIGTEGLPLGTVERLVDKAMEVCAGCGR